MVCKTPLYPKVHQLGSQLVSDYLPLVDVVISCNHYSGSHLTCLVDSGSDINLFPQDYAIKYLGFSIKTIKSGIELPVGGIGGSVNKAYGHYCDIHHPSFRLKHALVFFMQNQPLPLLGRIGFINSFSRIKYDIQNRCLEFTLGD